MNALALTPLIEALPQGFDFYHLGRIDLSPEGLGAQSSRPHGLDFADDRFAIAYRIEGELRGALLLVVEEGLDPSIYSEAGNIIASQLATQLAHERGLTLKISPPKVLTQSLLAKILKSSRTHAAMRTYTHRQENRSIELQAVLLPATAAPLEALGNA